MAMARMKRSYGTRDLPTYQRSDTLGKYLAQSPVGQDAVEAEENPMQQIIQQQMQQMMQDKMTSDPNKPDLAEAPWTGPLDPLGDY
jgi:hypothetical protein